MRSSTVSAVAHLWQNLEKFLPLRLPLSRPLPPASCPFLLEAAPRRHTQQER